MSLSLHSRRTSSSTKSSISSPIRTAFGCPTYRSTTLEPNHIFVEDQQMDEERWSRLAFALGIPSRDSHPPSPAASKFAQQVSSRRSVSSREMTELLVPLLASIAKDHETVKSRTNTAFHHDGVPDDIPDFEVERGWKMHLPTPKPAITMGYVRGTFTTHELDLQQGIIANSKNEPCDLHKLSQPVPDVYWPFFVVETQEESMSAARNACAGSGATCNNTLMILAGAAQERQKYRHDMDSLWNLNKAAQSFSLAVNGKTACLNTHNSEGCLPHAVAAIRTYRLDDDRDVEALASRIRSILIWAENCRLQSILDLLDDFNNRVGLAHKAMTEPQDRYIPTHLADFGVVPKSRRGAIKEVIKESLPRWVRT